MTRRRFSTPLLGLGLALGFAVTLLARQQPGAPAPATPDVKTLGPQIGATLPDFSLPDQQGRARTLSSLMGPKGLVLVFNRSAEW